MRAGMHTLVSHLIEGHGRRRIAFIRGLAVSRDAEERYEAYVQTLEQYGLPFDPGLVVSGDFRRPSGREAVKSLIETGHKGFDAVVSANDNMAIGALQVLQAQGIRVPEDVIVVGFDDIEETQATTPTLTTVRAPWHLLGSRSVDLVLAKLEKEPLPDQVLLEVRSCTVCASDIKWYTGIRPVDKPCRFGHEVAGIVAEVVLKAASAVRPQLRYTAGGLAARLAWLRRFAASVSAFWISSWRASAALRAMGFAFHARIARSRMKLPTR